MNQARRVFQERITRGMLVDLASEPTDEMNRENNLMKSWSDLDRTEAHSTATNPRGICHRLLRYHMNQILFAFLTALLSVSLGGYRGVFRRDCQAFGGRTNSQVLDPSLLKNAKTLNDGEK
jgi:hypothetical protein